MFAKDWTPSILRDFWRALMVIFGLQPADLDGLKWFQISEKWSSSTGILTPKEHSMGNECPKWQRVSQWVERKWDEEINGSNGRVMCGREMFDNLSLKRVLFLEGWGSGCEWKRWRGKEILYATVSGLWIWTFSSPTSDPTASYSLTLYIQVSHLLE